MSESLAKLLISESVIVINVSHHNTVIHISFKVWESQSGKELLSLTGHSDVVYCCAFSGNDARIVSCSADHTVKVWIHYKRVAKGISCNFYELLPLVPIMLGLST